MQWPQFKVQFKLYAQQNYKQNVLAESLILLTRFMPNDLSWFGGVNENIQMATALLHLQKRCYWMRSAAIPNRKTMEIMDRKYENERV